MSSSSSSSGDEETQQSPLISFMDYPEIETFLSLQEENRITNTVQNPFPATTTTTSNSIAQQHQLLMQPNLPLAPNTFGMPAILSEIVLLQHQVQVQIKSVRSRGDSSIQDFTPLDSIHQVFKQPYKYKIRIIFPAIQNTDAQTLQTHVLNQHQMVQQMVLINMANAQVASGQLRIIELHWQTPMVCEGIVQFLASSYRTGLFQIRLGTQLFPAQHGLKIVSRIKKKKIV